MKASAVIFGCGPSVNALAALKAASLESTTIACNRSIEVVAADYWFWMERSHYERSKGHENARAARRVGNRECAPLPDGEIQFFTPAVSFPCPEESLYLHGGTLSVATHFAIKLGAERIVFVGCDAWGPDRDRYHSWDALPLDAGGRDYHREHLRKTADGIRTLAKAYEKVEFLDATPADRHLGFPYVSLESIAATSRPIHPKGERMKRMPRALAPDLRLPYGYGTLVAVVPAGPEEQILWFQHPSGMIRALRVGIDRTNGLALELKGQAQIETG